MSRNRQFLLTLAPSDGVVVPLEVASRELVVLHATQLAALSAARLRRSGRYRVHLGGEFANDSQHEMWERELNRHLQDCGCDSGAFGLIVGVALGLLYWYLSRGVEHGYGPYVAILMSVAGAVAGKTHGRIRANIRFQRTIGDWQSSRHAGGPSGAPQLLGG